MKRRKRLITTLILTFGCLLGLSLLLYPTVSDYWNNNVVTHAVAAYSESVLAMDDDQYQEIWDSAVDYNRRLNERSNVFSVPDGMEEEYWNTLSVEGSDIMGYLEIPKIDVYLPIFHGTEDDVLQSGVGHLDWTHLPVGGEGTHCILSGHRGLLSAKLFTDLDLLREGDRFTLNILGETLTYEVDQIRIVLPEESGELAPVAGRDLCTLLTCTPYGVNTHRLLVRGHRVENDAVLLNVVSEAIIIDDVLVAVVLSIPLLFILMLMVIFKKPTKKYTKEQVREALLSENRE